jgi:hypothetical protein
MAAATAAAANTADGTTDRTANTADRVTNAANRTTDRIANAANRVANAAAGRAAAGRAVARRAAASGIARDRDVIFYRNGKALAHGRACGCRGGITNRRIGRRRESVRRRCSGDGRNIGCLTARVGGSVQANRNAAWRG